jgi:hypothetical protein
VQHVRQFVLRSAFTALCGLFAFTPSEAAQVRFDFVPYAGLYIPTSKVFDQFLSECSCQVSIKHKTNFILGGRVTLWWPSRVGVEGTFGYSPSGVTLAASGFGSKDTSAHVITASAKILVRVSPPGAPTSFHVGGGLGLVGHGGDAYGTSGMTRFGGILGAGVAFKAGSLLALRLDAEDHLYNAHFSSGGTSKSDYKFQNDLVLSVGLAVGGR